MRLFGSWASTVLVSVVYCTLYNCEVHFIFAAKNYKERAQIEPWLVHVTVFIDLWPFAIF